MEIKTTLGKYEPNEFIKIMTSEGPMRERMTATYILALEPHCFEHYKPMLFPPQPPGYFEEHRKYKEEFENITVHDEIGNKRKSLAWRKIHSKNRLYFEGYYDKKTGEKFLGRYAIEEINGSNKRFLEDMLAHFQEVGLKVHAEKVRVRILDFKQQNYEGF